MSYLSFIYLFIHSFGENVGNKQATLQSAVECLTEHPQVKLTALSSMIVTEPVGVPDQPEQFVNGAARFEVGLSPQQWLELLLETDLTVSIDVQEIAGQQGVSSLSSELVAEDGKARLGPVEVTYGGGYFKVEAAMDLVDTPELISVSGATSGWDFGKILDAVGLGIDAHGAKFDDLEWLASVPNSLLKEKNGSI